jgi:hypothetical protein
MVSNKFKLVVVLMSLSPALYLSKKTAIQLRRSLSKKTSSEQIIKEKNKWNSKLKITKIGYCFW